MAGERSPATYHGRGFYGVENIRAEKDNHPLVILTCGNEETRLIHHTEIPGHLLFCLLLILCIVVVFDISERLEKFIENDAPVSAIIFDYYMNFIPYFANVFSPLFTFISVIFFTSKMAYDSEIIAILSTGISFKRFLYPYFVSACIIAVFSFVLGGFIIPNANQKRILFQEQYMGKKYSNKESNIHRQIAPGVYLHVQLFCRNKYGLRFLH